MFILSDFSITVIDDYPLVLCISNIDIRHMPNVSFISLIYTLKCYNYTNICLVFIQHHLQGSGNFPYKVIEM